jgi:CheY-like chemotaxis protein
VLERLPMAIPRLGSPASASTLAPSAPAALLAITDDLEVRDLLLELAIEEGYGVRCVATDAEAGTVLLAERPGVVVVDLDMESGAGGKFLRLLRRSVHRNIPCMAVTATNDMMLSVALDLPVYFKPSLAGFSEAVRAMFVAQPSP